MQCSAVQCSALQWRLVQGCAVKWSPVQWSPVQWSPVQCNPVQCSVILFTPVLCSAVRAVYLSLLCTRPGNARPPPAFSKDWSWPGDLSDVPGSGRTAKCAQVRPSALCGALWLPSRPGRGCTIWQSFSPGRAGGLEGWRARSWASGPVDDLQKSPLVGRSQESEKLTHFFWLRSGLVTEVKWVISTTGSEDGPWNILESPRNTQTFLFLGLASRL